MITERTMVSRKDFEAWVELLGAEIVVRPDYRSGWLRVSGKTELGTEFSLQIYGAQMTVQGWAYARGAEGWSAVIVTDATKMSFFGKGARDVRNWQWAEEMLALLVG